MLDATKDFIIFKLELTIDHTRKRPIFDTPSLTNLLVEIMQPLFVLVAETKNQILGLESRFKISFLSPKVAQGRIELVVHTWWTPHHHPVLRAGDPSSCISGTIEVSEPST